MTSALLRKPLVVLTTIAVLAAAGLRFGPVVNGLNTMWAGGAQSLLAVAPISGGPSLAAIFFIMLVLFASGVVSGLAGFAFAAIAACVLWLLPPLQAVPLIMLLSACNQLLSIGKLRREIVLLSRDGREGALPYIIGGLTGVPLGVALLRSLPTDCFAFGFGLFLIVYSLFMLITPTYEPVAVSGWKPAVAVGALGGVVGGISGFGASILVVYLELRNADKSTVRGIIQPYIVAMQLVSLGVLVAVDPAVFNAIFWLLWAVTLPAVLIGTNTGVALCRRLSEHNFRHAVLILLILSGMSLIAKAVN